MNTLLVYTNLPGDSNSFNDTARTYCFGLPPITYFYDDFEDNTPLWTTNTPTLWQRGVPTSTVINHAHSPVKCWKTRLNGNYTNGRNDYLYSPMLNFTSITGAVLRFWHWWQAEPNDGGNLQYTLNGGTNWITLGYQNDPISVGWYNTFTNGKFFWNGEYGGWREAIYDLAQFNNKPSVKFRFYFYSDATLSSYNGWAVDDFEIRIPKLHKDAGVVAISEPDTVTSGLITPKITIHNYGLDTLTSIPLAYVISGGGMMIETWNGVLPPDSNVDYTFTNHYTSPIAGYTFCSFTALGPDTYRFNDSLCMHVSSNIGTEQYSYYGFTLGQNVPNPAGNETTIPYFIPEKGGVRFAVTDMYGKTIYATETETAAGSHSITLPLQAIAPGVYFYTLTYDKRQITKKMVIER
jgi:hypothetical protein